MKKILVLTDLSPNSRPGITFAIQLAVRSKSALVFFHVVELLKPRRWSEKQYQEYVKKELESHHRKLLTYVGNGYRKISSPKPPYMCIVKSGHDVAKTVITYAEKTKATAICLSTRGAGTIKKVIGTTASRIIDKSRTPVFVIPLNYQKAPLKEIFYATDLHNFKEEIKRIQHVADLTNARITACHYDYFLNLVAKLKQINKITKDLSSTRHRLRIRELEPGLSLSSQVLNDMEVYKASLGVLFTDQKKTWFKKLFLPQNSAELTFSTKKPLLIFEK